MATFDMCQICYDDKLVIPCGSMGVCDKKICKECHSHLSGYKCVFCFQVQPKLQVIYEIEDRFNWACGQGPPKIDTYIKRYNVWSYGCLEMDGCECGMCETNDYQDEILRNALLNEERVAYGDEIQADDYDPFGEMSNP